MHAGTPKHIVAVESGGSHCRAILFSPSGNKILRRVILNQPANIATSRDSVLDALYRVLEEFAAADSMDRNDTQLTLCLAGTEDKGNVAWLESELAWPGTLHITADTIAGIFGVFNEPMDGCGVLIGGTGNIAVGYSSRKGFFCVGGRGDERELCCGYSLGWHALMSQEMCDNRKFQEICTQVARANGLASLNPKTSSKFAVSQLAPHIFDLAEKDHVPAALALIGQAAEGGFDFLKKLHDHGIRRFGLIGGVAQRLLPLMKERIKQTGADIDIFCAPEAAGHIGALNVARYLSRNSGILKTLNTMHTVEIEGT